MWTIWVNIALELMEIEFRHKELEDLYEGRPVKSKAFNSNANLIKGYIKAINMIRAASDLNMLKKIKGLNLEKLTNDPNNFSSVRIDGKYRLIVDLVEDGDGEVRVVGIEEITNHYS